AAALLPHHRCDRAGDLDVVGGEVDVERDQRPARTDDDAARVLVEPRRPIVRAKLARIDAALELLWTSAPVERRASLRCGVAVEEHRQPQLGPDPVRKPQRAISRPLAVFGIEGDDRHDVRSPDSGMSAFVAAQVDPYAGT